MHSENASFVPVGVRQLLGPTFIISLLTLLGMVVSFLTQAIMASLFGAGPDMDAYWAANTLPQYVVTILLSALSVVFIPVFIDHLGTGRNTEAWEVASGVLNLSVLSLSVLALLGIVFAQELLRWTVPGLSSQTLSLAVLIARVSWPGIVASGLISLLTGIYQAQREFSWPALVPVLGALTTLVLVVLVGRQVGVLGLALASLAGLLLQVVLLVGVVIRGRAYRLILGLNLPGLRQVWRLLWPLLISGMFIRASTVIDRYVASSLTTGSISQLSYAFKVIGVISILLSTGMTTAIFPRMALWAATDNIQELRQTVSLGLRMMWVVVAPTLFMSWVLAPLLITVLFRHGAFTTSDALDVSQLLRWYLLALTAMTCGNIIARTFYVLKDTRTVATMGVVEIVAYALYTPWLAERLGVTGIALAYVVYFNSSLLWQVAVIWHKLGQRGGWSIFGSLVRTAVAALVGGLTAWGGTRFSSLAWLQLLAGGTLGITAYALALFGLRSVEAQMIWDMILGRLKQTNAFSFITGR